MKYQTKLNATRLMVFHEGKKRRVFVGTLIYDPKKKLYTFEYDRHYVSLKNAISLGPELSIFKLHHTSSKGKLFPSLLDRIPLRSNLAYKDYCRAQEISVDEKNPIILLGFIGKRGPSSFIFEPVYESAFTSAHIKKLRQQLQITQHDLALAFGIKKITLQMIESGKSSDARTLKLLQIYFTFPEVALWQIQQTSGFLHSKASTKLISYFKKEASK